LQVASSSKKTVILPPVLRENNKRREKGTDTKEKRDTGKVLARRINMAKKRNMLREEKRGRRGLELFLPSSCSSFEKSFFKFSMEHVRVNVRRGRGPSTTKGRGEFRGSSEPRGDRTTRIREDSSPIIRKMDREMVGKRMGRIPHISRNVEVGVMERDRNSREDNRVIREGNRKKEAINARRPRKRRSGIIGNMIESMVVVGGIK